MEDTLKSIITFHKTSSVPLLTRFTQGPAFTTDAVFSHDGFLLGTEASYDVSKGQITRYAAGVGFSAPEYAVTLLAGDSFQKYSASYYHRVSRDVEAGGRAEYDARRTADGVKLEVGAKA